MAKKELDKSEKKPETENKKPTWLTLSQAELERIIIDLVKQGETPTRIGLTLRDKHGVPKMKLTGKRISEIIKNAKLSYKTEKEAMQENIKVLEQHIGKNKYDMSAKRSLAKKLWAVRKLQ